MTQPSTRIDPAGAVAAGLAAEAPDLPADILEITKRLGRLQALVVAATSAVLGELGLSHGEYDVLAVLLSAGEPYRARPTDLGRRMLFTTGGVSNLLKGLEARGLVDRAPDPGDRRSSLVGLTGDGLRTARAVVRDAVAVQRRLLAPADPRALRAVIDGLAAVLPAVEQAAKGLPA